VDEQERKQSEEKVDWNIRPYLAIGLISFLVIIGSISFFFLIYRYHGFTAILDKVLVIVQPITIGLIIAYLLTPVVNFEERHLLPLAQRKMKNQEKAKKMVRAASVAGALLFIALVIGILLQMVIPELYKSINGMIGTLPKQVNEFMDWISDYVDNDSEISGYLEIGLTKGTEFFEHWAKTDFLPQTRNIVTGLTTGVIEAIRILFHVVVGIIISIYVLMSKETLIGQSKKVVYALFCPRKANAIIHTVHKSNEIFGGFISGKILDSLIIGILCFICLYLMKMPYSVLVSVIVGVTNVIPFFGPYLGAIPSTILIMLANPIQGVYFVIFILVLQQIDGNIIGPKILGDSTGLSSFWVVFAILVGGGIFGIPGMIIGVPLFAVIYYVLRNVLNYIIKKKNLPLESEKYILAERLNEENRELVEYEQQELLHQASQEKKKSRFQEWRKKFDKKQQKK
jgi:predicted PurR-regulated permease PerM